MLTRHGKELAIAPVLADGLEARLRHVDDVDTDLLGTFTREVPRAGSQVEAARRKARLAMERSGLPLGLGSEGAFVPGPLGLGCWDLEIVMLVDAERGLEVIGRARRPGLHVQAAVGSREELAIVAQRARFPAHALVVRPDHGDHPQVRKGIRDRAALDEAYDEARRRSVDGVVFVENDLRAHRHPTRMAVVAQAASDLVARLRCACPACGRPGFGREGAVPGLPCRGCGLPTREPIAEDFTCTGCGYRVRRALPVIEAGADPAVCDFCNP